MGKSRSILTSYTYDVNERLSEHIYNTYHHSTNRNGTKVRGGAEVDQQLIIKGDLSVREFKASMSFVGMPQSGIEREAALKLAEWMQRMSAAIEDFWSEP